MSKCDLRIVFDEPGRIYTVGETVRGRLEVSVNAECTCNGLTIGRRWRTHGRGNRASGGDDDHVLFRGTFMPGQQLSYPFELELPMGPLTYHGHYLNVDWYIDARADIPWAFDPKAEEEIVVVAGERAAEVELGTWMDRAQAMAAGPRMIAAACGTIFGGVFFLAGLVALVITTAVTVVEGQPAILIGLPLGLIFMGVGGGIAFVSVRNILAQQKLGPVEIVVEPDVAKPGDEVRCAVRFSPRAEASLNAVTATLIGKERVVSGSGTNQTTRTHVLHREEVVLDDSRRTVHKGDAVDLATTLHVPEDAPFSFAAPSNYLQWEIEVHIDIAGWPDWKNTRPVVVRP